MRTKRMKVKTTSHSGQRRIFFVLERATRKFNGDLGLWMQYVSFARKQRSNKKVSEILTQMLRLFPTKPAIWIYAASYALEERADMVEARSLMQKGLRLCNKSEELWIEYARLEMIYIAKLAARSKVLGLDQDMDPGHRVDDCGEKLQVDVTADDVDALRLQDRRGEQDAPEKLNYMSARSEAVPLAIFDAAMKVFENDSHFPWDFFDMVAEYNVEARQGILSHISDSMQSRAPNSVEFLVRFVQQPVLGLDPLGHVFPMSLATALDRLEPAMQKLETPQCRQIFHNRMADWVRKFLGIDGLDGDIRHVLHVALRKVQRQFEAVEA